MKNISFISLLAVLALCGCQTKELDDCKTQSFGSISFTGIVDDSFYEETKTSLDGDGNVLWKKGDQVSIFAGKTVNGQYQVTDASDCKKQAEFQKVSEPSSISSSDISNNVAFYPYASSAAIVKKYDNYEISGITLPSTQEYAAGSFGDGAFPMVAVTGSTSDLTLKFKNVLGCLKLQLKGTASIASISVTGNSNEILCGAASVTAATGVVPSINLTDESAKTVTLDCGSGVALNSSTATPFVIALPPVTMTGGFTVVVRDTEGKEMEIKTTKSQTIVRSKILKMPEVNYEGVLTSQKPVNAISGIFSVSSENKVYFAKGNLQSTYDSGTYSWGFAENQYDIIAGSGATDDLFCWSGSSHYNYGLSSQTASSYYDGYFLEWGVKIDNEGTWRTLSEAEWRYLLGTSTERNGKHKNWVNVNGVNGLVIAPDDFAGTIEDSYTASTWATAEQNGLVFLPIAGYRYGTNINNTDTYGYYWSSTSTSQYSQYASSVCISASVVGVTTERYRRYAGCVRLVCDVTGPYPVDLGLSVKWASCNVGARTPYGFGNYYAWGDTEGHGFEFSGTSTKTNFFRQYYKYGNGVYIPFEVTKYFSGDDKTILEQDDDVAVTGWGNDWRMPTNEEMKELVNTGNCSWTWYAAGNTEFNGVAGYKIQSLIPGYTDNYIFLPAAGWWYENSYKNFLTEGYYWTSSLYAENEWAANLLMFNKSSVSNSKTDRWLGGSIRPVCH